MKYILKKILILFCSLFFLTSCTNSYYSTKYQAKNIKRFSIAKRSGVGRIFIKNKKQKLSPTYTKTVRDYYGK